MQYYLQYMVQEVAWGVNIHFQVGSAAHEAVALALTQRKTPVEMVAVFQNSLRKDGVDPDTIQYWTISAIKMFQGWAAWRNQHNIDVVLTEEKILKSNFLGVIDCIADVDGERYIIDWKTSSRPYTQQQADSDGQVTAYMWLAARHKPKAVAYGILNKVTGEFQFLSSTRTKDDIQVFLNGIKEMREKIANYHSREFVPMNIGRHCNRCSAYEFGVCEGRDDF